MIGSQQKDTKEEEEEKEENENQTKAKSVLKREKKCGPERPSVPTSSHITAPAPKKMAVGVEKQKKSAQKKSTI